MCTALTAGAYGGQKRVLHALELELWTVCVGAENRTQVLCRCNKCS